MSEAETIRAPAPNLLQLFAAFAGVSMIAFGGVLPWARRMIVERRRWMTAEEFNEAFALCQFLPGPNIVNFSVVFGLRMRGGRGALAAVAGVLGPPLATVMLLGALYARYAELAALQRVLAGLAAAAAGLIIAASAKMAEQVFRRRAGPAPLVAMAVFVAVGVMRWPLGWVVLVATPVSIALAWWQRR